MKLTVLFEFIYLYSLLYRPKTLAHLQICWNKSGWIVQNLRSKTFRFLSRV